jgi:hypothetical protein
VLLNAMYAVNTATKVSVRNDIGISISLAYLKISRYRF